MASGLFAPGEKPGTAAAAVAAHEAAADPHPQYLTTAEGNAAYATAAQGAKADAAAVAGAIGSSGLTMTAGLVGRESGTGAPQVFTLGSGLSIVGGALVATGGSGTVTSVALSLPGIFTVTGSPITGAGTLTATLATQAAGLVWAGPASGPAAAPTFRQLGYSELSGLPSLGGAAYLSVGTTPGTVGAGDDSRFFDSREWSASTISQAEAEAGTATTRRAFTAQRVFQAIAAWWQTNTSAVGRSVATAVDQAAARTAIGAGTSSVVVSDNTPQINAAVGSPGTSPAAARADHAHQRDTTLIVVNLSGSQSDPVAQSPVETLDPSFSMTLLTAYLGSETAASGSAFEVDVTLNGTTVFSTRPRIGVGQTTSMATGGAIGVFSQSNVNSNDKLRFNITQAGGGCRLAKLYIVVRRTSG